MDHINRSVFRTSMIHGDASDYNILVGRDGKVTSILDYGDVVYSATVCELAIMLAYLMLGKPDPVQAAATVVRADHEVLGPRP